MAIGNVMKEEVRATHLHLFLQWFLFSPLRLHSSVAAHVCPFHYLFRRLLLLPRLFDCHGKAESKMVIKIGKNLLIVLFSLSIDSRPSSPPSHKRDDIRGDELIFVYLFYELSKQDWKRRRDPISRAIFKLGSLGRKTMGWKRSSNWKRTGILSK